MFIADLHIHSRYSRATSPHAEPVQLDYWARRKGLQLIASGDFTHAVYREDLRRKLFCCGEGLYALKEEYRIADAGLPLDQKRPRFIVSGEISSIYKDKGRVRKVHNLILLPSLQAAENLSLRLEALGCNLHSDGRPIIGVSSHDLLELTLEACDEAVFIPAHIWTPHFSLFGAYSGYDTIEECFGDLTPYIHALETGLSSDPQMNYRLSALAGYALVSNSDAHSPANLAREANLFDCELSYPAIARALSGSGSKEFAGTIEFFPEEGKYHWDGHRNCRYSSRPGQTIAQGGLCPVCGGKLTLGVSHRVEILADRPEDYISPLARPYQKLVPLMETLAACLGMTVAAKKVKNQYEQMLQALGPELYILREASCEKIARASSPIIAEGIARLRAGQVHVAPGYDGEYGKVRIFTPEELAEWSGQISLFSRMGYLGEEAYPAAGEDINPAGPSPSPFDDESGQGFPYGLNEEQWRAVSSPAREIVVQAGPGTGKTRTLIYRIVRLIEQGATPNKIMAVTFTHKAAKELRERLAAHFPDRKILRAIRIGTFHALSLAMLREHKIKTTLIDEGNALMLAEELITEQSLPITPGRFLKALSRYKNSAGDQEDGGGLTPEIYALYQEKLAEYQAADFDDVLLAALKLAGEKSLPPGTHLLVDEFQDINDLQLSLIEAWGREAASLFIIGDPDQAIYGFRGASAACFGRFLCLHPQAQTITLRENYRSTKDILDCARPLQGEGNSIRQLCAKRNLSLPVRLVAAESPLSEGIFLASEIDRIVGGMDMIKAHSDKKGNLPRESRGLADIAVLYRTHRQAEQIAACLDVAGIPYTVSGRDDFLTDNEVRLCLAFFRFLLDKNDTLSRRFCEKNLKAAKLAQLSESFIPLLKRKKADALVETWIEKNFLGEHKNMEKLRKTALLCPTLADLLNNALIGEEADVVRSGGKEYRPEAVSLMTLHGAKGLEFPVVFLAGVKEGVVPFRAKGMTGDIDEEKRLLYVGMTRAQDELILISRPEPSSFLSLIPEQLLLREQAQIRLRVKTKQLNLFEEK